MRRFIIATVLTLLAMLAVWFAVQPNAKAAQPAAIPDTGTPSVHQFYYVNPKGQQIFVARWKVNGVICHSVSNGAEKQSTSNISVSVSCTAF